MKKPLLISLILVVSFSFSNAQDAVKAKQILDQVSLKTKAFTSISAEFSFSLENLQEKINDSHNGSIKVKGNKYKVSLMNVDSYFDGKSLYTHLKDADEVNISTPDTNDEGILNPAKIFTMYEKGFKYNFIGEKTEAGKTLYEIDLFPDNRDKPFSRIKLQIWKDNLQLYTLKQVGKDGNNYTIKVKKMDTNQPFTDSDFVFNSAANPNVDVIDMR